MADKEKKAVNGSEVDKAATEESKAAAKVAKAAKGNSKKSDRPGFFARAGKSTKSFFKNFKGETKKIVWPDAKMVLKSTGIVLLVVAIVSIIIYGIDQGLSAGITGLKKLATNETSISETVEDETTGKADESKKDDSKEDTSKEETKEDNKEKTSEKSTSEANSEKTAEEETKSK